MTINPTRRMIINGILFQLGWFMCVLGGNVYALIWLLPYLYVHFRYISQSPGEWLFVFAVTTLGISLDSVALHVGIFSIPGNPVFPLWLACLWVLFATAIPHCLSWLQGRPAAAALFGALGGSMSYLAGIKLGAARSDNTSIAVIYWAVQWAVLLPGLLLLASHIPAVPQRQHHSSGRLAR